MDVLFMQAKRYLSKITASHFSTLNTKIANQNVLTEVWILQGVPPTGGEGETMVTP